VVLEVGPLAQEARLVGLGRRGKVMQAAQQRRVDSHLVLEAVEQPPLVVSAQHQPRVRLIPT
jgi:hypothetical protein